MNTRQVDEYVKRMKRRQRFLEDCVNRGTDTGFDHSELAALEWAIRYIQDTTLEAADHQSKYFNEKRTNEQS